jgi:hypothetical protein
MGGLSRRFSQEESMCGRQICCKVSSGRCCGWIYEMKVARMQVGRVYTYQRDRIHISRMGKADQCIAIRIVMIIKRSRVREGDDVLMRIETADCGLTNGDRPGRKHKIIVTHANRHRGVLSSVNRVVAVADRYVIPDTALSAHEVVRAVAQGNQIVKSILGIHCIASTVAKSDVFKEIIGRVGVHGIMVAVAESN